MDSLAQDVRFAVRTLLRSKGFTVLAVLCLAVGIGLNTTLFSALEATVLRPMPFADPERVVTLHLVNPKIGVRRGNVPYPDLEDWQRESRAFTAIAASAGQSLTFTEGDEPEQVRGAPISWNTFGTLGVRPLLGRDFRVDDDRVGAPATILLSHEVFTRRFGGDASIIGRSVMVNGTGHTVIGVMPERFKFPFAAEAWVPLTPVAHGWKRGDRALEVFGRLAPSTTVEQASADLAAIAARVAAQHPATNRDFSAAVRPVREYYAPEQVIVSTTAAMGAVTFVLLIACANVANLMLARATARKREIALRAALGAGRGRVVRQLLVECVLVALMAGLLGALVAVWGLDVLAQAMPVGDAVPFVYVFAPNAYTFLYAVGISIATGLIFGLAPALQATRGDLVSALKAGTRGAGPGAAGNRLRSALVVGEVALAIVLLVGAALMVRSFMKLQRAELGFDPAPLMTMRFAMTGDAYATPADRALRVRDVVRRVEALPGVEAAFVARHIPLGDGAGRDRAIVDGRALPAGEEPTIVRGAGAGHFLRTMGLPVLRGRDLTDAEVVEGRPVAVVNERMARQLWPAGADALGGRFRLAGDSTRTWITVVGIAPDVKLSGAQERDPQPAAYLAYAWEPASDVGLVVRAAGRDAASLTASVRAAVRASDASLPLFDIRTMTEVRTLGYWQYELFGTMFSIYGAIALLLATVGVYGVLAYLVTLRTHEIGVRMALGARAIDVLGLIVGRGMRLAGLGIVVGLLASLAVNQTLGALLYEVGPADPVSFLAIALLLIATALLACYLPARRATRVDPVVALRSE